MAFFRPLPAVLLTVLLVTYAAARGTGASPPLGILTQAYQAHVDEAMAFPGLSIYDGEQLWTDRQGRISVRVGRSLVNLAGNTQAMVFRITGGVLWT